ncbi:universal stress protein [Ramlibacter solisilvae]|uniref:Universal stress protein UspA n=1 Tax=Ramlibacter tataouinensis TaxID=94132 RepID=A0A127JR60_9BURK|nr:universal stress protein [Ramlibacter tataouinensis]AMO22439.1 universal stress protein UspA [Ramlibacter tataouinensis]
MSSPLKQLLVHFDDSPAALKRLDVARRLAAAQGGLVTALYAVTPTLMDVPFAAEAGAAAVAALRDIDCQRQQRARAGFELALDESPGVRAHWAEATAYPVAAALAAQAFYADLLVLGQPDPKLPDTRGLVESVLNASGKPALVVPHAETPQAVGETIAIAWKPAREAARALAAAVPLLQRAREVHVMSWGPQEDDGVRGSHLNLDGYLHERGIQPQWHREPAEPDFIGELLLSRAFDLGADLLVMGCYGHSRAREWVLGGASRTVLRSMTIPVLMAH